MLLQAFVPVVNNTVCSQESHFPLDQLTNRTLCAGTNVSGGARGDYGGPLQAPDGSNRWFLTGIFSNMLTYPPTGMDPLRWYMRTSAYCDFIRDVTQGEVYCVDPNKNETITTVTSTMPTSTTSTTTSTTTKTNPNMFTTTIIFSIFMFILCNLL
uniref:Peptidase S1 domain-containing protein n=1 Tax=Acrobeloides nanus TaxID=290746 RepID=A0A914E8R5_9BILA